MDDGPLSVVRALRETLVHLPAGGADRYGRIIAAVKEKTGFAGKKLFLPIRAVVTGKTSGPELDKVFAVLSPASLKYRIEMALKVHRG
jgi:nondiscriminating glutamyl-tRNA synthetase